MPILGSKFGYIDKNGHLIIPPQFDRCYEYTDGLATVEIEGKYGFIDKNRDFVIPPQFESAFGFMDLPMYEPTHKKVILTTVVPGN